MIMFYFSGTGNSKYIAELFCKNMGSKCHSIEEDIDFTHLIASEKVVGFCYPVYGSRVPRIMREFAARYMGPLKDKRIIIFCTQMFFSGDGARAFTDIFPRGHVKVIYAEHFLMPNNVNNLFIFPLDSDKRILDYLLKAHRKMRIVCKEIADGKIKKRGFNPASRMLGNIQGSFYPEMERKARGKVWIDKDCDKCLLCVSVCPMKNFEYENGEISTKSNCTICYRCINGCPQKAISVYMRGKVKKQYGGLGKYDV